MRRSHSSSNGLKKVKEGAVWISVFPVEAVACAKALWQQPPWHVWGSAEKPVGWGKELH